MPEEIQNPEQVGNPEPEGEKITFTESQQSKINEIIKGVSARAGKEARAEAERLRLELERERAKPAAAAENTALELATAKAELAAVRREQEESKIRTALLDAVAKEGFYDATLAADLLRSAVKWDGQRLIAIDASGAERLGADLDPLSPAELAKELAESRPYLVRGQVKTGAGSTMSQSHRTETTIPLEAMFGRAATPQGVGSVHKLANNDPAKYQQLRAAARAKGLV